MSNEQIENATILNNTSLIIMSIGLFADKPQLIHVALVMVLISLIITLILLVRNFRFKNEEEKNHNGTCLPFLCVHTGIRQPLRFSPYEILILPANSLSQHLNRFFHPDSIPKNPHKNSCPYSLKPPDHSQDVFILPATQTNTTGHQQA